MRRAEAELDAWKPHLILPVDYPGFNLRLAHRARNRGIEVAYYIAPQVWAWRRDRRPGIRRAVDHLLVVFPFEEPLFREAGIQTTFVGHPLLDAKPGVAPSEVRARLGISAKDPLLALLPGSRAQEVSRILPSLVEGTSPLRERGVLPIVSRAEGVPGSLYAVAEERGLPIWEADAGSLVGAADAALVASGTATLETGLSGTPLAVVYRTGFLNWHLARLLVGIRTVGLVNIAAGGSRVPELLQGECNPTRVHEVSERLLFDPREREEQTAYLSTLRDRLGGGGSAERTAEVLAGLLEESAR